MNIKQDEVNTDAEAVLKRSIRSPYLILASLMVSVSRISLVLVILMIVAFGTTATLISKFYRQDLSQGLGVGVAGYGFPLSWYRETQIVYPYMPVLYSFHWDCFVLDIIFWSLFVTIPIAIVLRWLRVRK